MIYEYTHDEYRISTDPELLDLKVIHEFLTRSYWAEGRSRATVERSVAHSFPFGLYHLGKQIGFARVITDYAVFAYLADVFVLEAYRGRGLSKWLMQVIMECPEFDGLKKWMLATADAHGLYARFGFTPLPKSEIYMERSLKRP